MSSFMYRHYGKRAAHTDVILDSPAHAARAAEWLRNHGYPGVSPAVIQANLEPVQVKDGAAFKDSFLISDRLNFVS